MAVQPKRKRNRVNSARTRAWTSMRVMRRFSMPELMATASIGKINVRKYVGALRRFGYVRLACASRFEPGSFHVFQLIRNTGPKAPILRSNGEVFDPNTEALYGGDV